jgi:hypothetical protein
MMQLMSLVGGGRVEERVIDVETDKGEGGARAARVDRDTIDLAAMAVKAESVCIGDFFLQNEMMHLSEVSAIAILQFANLDHFVEEYMRRAEEYPQSGLLGGE